MGISLAPQVEEQPDPLKPKPAPKPPAASPTSAPAPAIGLAPAAAPQSPGKAGGIPAMTPPAMTAPTPTVAAPSAPVDRQALALGTFDNLAAQRQAKYNTESRDNIRTSAALGQVASGGLRTREGDLRLARDRDLDQLQRDLSLKAAEASVADATTAYQQQLAGSQQGLAEKIGLAGIENQKGALDLEKEKLAVGTGQTQQQIDLAKKAQADSIGLEKERLGLAAGAQEVANRVALGQLSIAQATAALDEKVRMGQLTLAERNQALAELSQQQTQGNEQQRIQLAKEQLAQTATQFGLSLAQQKELATLADKTANRQLDISSAQGQNSLLLELARIMGSKDLASIPPEFLASIAKALGIALPVANPVTDTVKPTYIKPSDPTGDADTEIPTSKIMLEGG